MRILKSHPFLKLFNAYLIDHSQPSNINYLWNFGSLLGVMFRNTNNNRCNISNAL